MFFTTTLATLLPARARGVRSVLTLHLNSPRGLAIPGNLLALAYEKVVGRFCARLADQLVAVGPSVAAHAQRTWRLSNSPLVIPNGVDCQQFAPASIRPTRPVALFVGRMLDNKGPGVFVAAARRLHADRIDAEFWLAGDGPLLNQLRAASDDEPRIRLLGHRDDVADLMRTVTVLARPSTLEGLPLTVLEGMAAGLAVVATDIPGNADLIEHGRTGLLCAPDSSEALATALRSALEDSHRAGELGLRARARVLKDYTWGAATHKFESLAFQMKKELVWQPA